MLGKSIVVALTPASSNSSQLSSTSSPFDMAFKFQFYAHTLSKCSDWAAMPFSSNFCPFTKPNRGKVYRLYLTKKNPQKSRRRILSFFLFLGSVAFHMAVMVVLTKYFNLFLNDDWLLNFHDINLFMSKHSVRATTTINNLRTGEAMMMLVACYPKISPDYRMPMNFVPFTKCIPNLVCSIPNHCWLLHL